MAFISIDLDSDMMRALKAAAAADKLSPEHFLQKLVAEAVGAPTALGWEAKEVLQCLRRANTRPGAHVPLQSLIVLWFEANATTGSASMWRGIDELIAAELLTLVEDGTANIALTERFHRTCGA